MKKKIIGAVLAFAMVFSCCFALIGCKTIKKVVDDIDVEETETYTDNLKTEAQIKAALGDNYYVAVTVTATTEEGEETEHYTVASNGTYMYTNFEGSGEVLLKKLGDNYYLYGYNEQESKYESVVMFESTVNPFTQLLYLFAYNTSIKYTSKSDTTFLGRSVVEYVMQEGVNLYGYSYHYTEKTIIDKATGACLKHSWEATGNTPTDLVTASAIFTCTSFETNNNAITEFLQPMINKIDVAEWDTTFFTSAGATLTQPNATFVAAVKTEEGYTFTYNFVGDENEGKNAIDALVSELFESNYKVDANESEEQESCTAEAIYSYDSGYKTLSYNARHTTNDYGVEIEAEYLEGAWTMVMTFTVYPQ